MYVYVGGKIKRVFWSPMVAELESIPIMTWYQSYWTHSRKRGNACATMTMTIQILLIVKTQLHRPCIRLHFHNSFRKKFINSACMASNKCSCDCVRLSSHQPLRPSIPTTILHVNSSYALEAGGRSKSEDLNKKYWLVHNIKVSLITDTINTSILSTAKF